MITFGGNTLTVDGAWLTEVDPLNPLGLPPYTLRCRFTSGYTPTQGTSRVQVSASPNVWDITKDTPDAVYGGVSWSGFFKINDYTGCQQLIEILGANSSGVTQMQFAFAFCSNLSTVSLFDTSDSITLYGLLEGTAITHSPDFDLSSAEGVEMMYSRCRNLVEAPSLNTEHCVAMAGMFADCTSITRVPMTYSTSSCQYIGSMFSGCTNVSSGAYEFYQQISQEPSIITHENVFTDCGINTVTGRADLQRIPTSYGGLME